jgi:hypothetical protein
MLPLDVLPLDVLPLDVLPPVMPPVSPVIDCAKATAEVLTAAIAKIAPRIPTNIVDFFIIN